MFYIFSPDVPMRFLGISPEAGLAMDRAGAMFGGFAFLLWRGAPVKARRAQIAMLGSVAMGLILLAMTGLAGYLRQPDMPGLAIASGAELAWATALLLALRRPRTG
ncbi:hypothetical protein [Roseobacter sp. HKCCA0434]|uniref:hypothetical protein n=1 Tax=Roseobacter sp. HKCCA0434 TaxID=3079297 RepID=UPI002905E2B8|nr:hypothetical protein [Roseobacter sp. HKCCA0434]